MPGVTEKNKLYRLYEQLLSRSTVGEEQELDDGALINEKFLPSEAAFGMQVMCETKYRKLLRAEKFWRTNRRSPVLSHVAEDDCLPTILEGDCTPTAESYYYALFDPLGRPQRKSAKDWSKLKGPIYTSIAKDEDLPSVQEDMYKPMLGCHSYASRNDQDRPDAMREYETRPGTEQKLSLERSRSMPKAPGSNRSESLSQMAAPCPASSSCLGPG